MTNQTTNHFPLDLPNATAVSGLRPAKRTRATEQENAARAVRGYTRDPGMTCEVTWIFDNYQSQDFANWWNVKLKQGLSWFWVRLPTRDGLDSWQLARFATQYEMTPEGATSYTVRATLEVRDRFLRKERPYVVPEPLAYSLGDPGEDDPLWEQVRFAADYSDTWELKDAKNDVDPVVYGDVNITTGPQVAEFAYVKGNEAYLEYEENEDNSYALNGVQAWTVDFWFRNLGGEKDSVLWSIHDQANEPDFDPYTDDFGMAVRRGTLFFFAVSRYSGVRFEAPLRSVLLPQNAWYHGFVQERKGMIEIGIAPYGAETGVVTILAPQFFNLPYFIPKFIVGATLGGSLVESQYNSMKFFTGGVDDLRLTRAIRYP